LLFDDRSVSNTIPQIICDNESSTVAHEASAGKINEQELFYLTSRGIEEQKAI
jgi:Fe-S cluster assembly scaffold protein SufB